VDTGSVRSCSLGFETKRLTDGPPWKRVVWIACPPEGTTLIFTVLFSAPGVP
jgi:hypothetical protein